MADAGVSVATPAMEPVTVQPKDLPVFCPNPNMPLWSSHPRVYLDVAPTGNAMCPYCGTRIQKRAPKLDRGGVPRASKRARTRPSLPRLRPGEIPGIRADRRAWAAWLLVAASLLVTVAVISGLEYFRKYLKPIVEKSTAG